MKPAAQEVMKPMSVLSQALEECLGPSKGPDYAINSQALGIVRIVQAFG